MCTLFNARISLPYPLEKIQLRAQALHIFAIMKQRGLHRNTILYATLIKAEGWNSQGSLNYPFWVGSNNAKVWFQPGDKKVTLNPLVKIVSFTTFVSWVTLIDGYLTGISTAIIHATDTKHFRSFFESVLSGNYQFMSVHSGLMTNQVSPNWISYEFFYLLLFGQKLVLYRRLDQFWYLICFSRPEIV